MFRVVLSFVVILTAAGQTAIPGNGSASRPGAVRGTIVGAGGEPLRKAEVQLRSAGAGGPSSRMPQAERQSAWTHTTDASGAFSFDAVSPGTYTLTVQRNGYVRSDGAGRTGRGSSASLTVAPGQEITGVTVKLSPHSVIAGKVTDEDGEPVAFAAVQVLRERWTNGRRQFVPMSGGTTNDLGEYRVHGLIHGHYYLTVSDNRRSPTPFGGSVRRADGAPDMNYAPLFYPGVVDMAQAVPVTLAPGQEMRGADFQLRKVPTFRVRGKVLDVSGKPAMYTAVMAMPAEGGWAGVRAMGVVRRADGAFEIAGLQPGSYNLVVQRGGGRGDRDAPRGTARMPVQVGNRDLEGVIVQMQSALDINGTIRVAGEGVQLGSARVMAEPLEGTGPGFGSGETQTKPDGTWFVHGLAPGKYRFGVAGLPQGTYVKSVSVGGQDITAGASISASASGVEVVLGTDAPEITGAVTKADKQPMPNATVVLVPEMSRREQYWLFRTTAADQNGSFRLAGFPPGQYSVYAFENIEDGQWYSPEFLKSVDGKGSTVTLKEGSRETVQVIPAL